MNRYLLFTCCLCLHATQAIASDPSVGQYWERDAALSVAGAANIDTVTIGDVSTLADAEATLQNLARLESRSDLPWPVREATLYRFARSLAALPRDAVATEIMQYLNGYEPRTLVPHEERADVYVPLFDIRSAARGVEHGWQRAEASTQATKLLQHDPLALLDAFGRAVSIPRQRGYLDALPTATAADLAMIQEAALSRLAETPDLTALVASAALIRADEPAMRELLINGRGASLAPAFRQFEQRLGTDALAGLLEFAVYQAPPGNASLAIAAWWPRLRHDPTSRELMLGLLEDRDLGSSAALALSQSPDIQTIKQLQVTAAGDSGAARHAQMALDLNRAKLGGEGLK